LAPFLYRSTLGSNEPASALGDIMCEYARLVVTVATAKQAGISLLRIAT
jgi:hypothetical protein